MRFFLSCSATLVFSLSPSSPFSRTFVYLRLRSSSALAAENLFLRKQQAMYVERKQKPRRATDSDRLMLAKLMRSFDWPSALTVVNPDTLVRSHRKGFRLFWKWKSRREGRPSIAMDLGKLIRDMATNNPTWGEERISDELLLKLGIRISPRTVRRYMPLPPKGQKNPDAAMDDFRS